eukprot:scaffold10507_cov128-Cylindrotheca_fusiformis.AAC.1
MLSIRLLLLLLLLARFTSGSETDSSIPLNQHHVLQDENPVTGKTADPPVKDPTIAPTIAPVKDPIQVPTIAPTIAPAKVPTQAPANLPTTDEQEPAPKDPDEASSAAPSAAP